MLITGVSHVYFYVRTPSTEANNCLFVDAAKDRESCRKILEKIHALFMKCVFPELLSYKNDPSNENNDQTVFAEDLSFHHCLDATTENL